MEARRQDLEMSLPPGIRSLPVAVLSGVLDRDDPRLLRC
jgi:hypothetical protein